MIVTNIHHCIWHVKKGTLILPDPHRCNKKGHSPFNVAQQKDFKEILDIIEQHSSHEIP